MAIDSQPDRVIHSVVFGTPGDPTIEIAYTNVEDRGRHSGTQRMTWIDKELVAQELADVMDILFEILDAGLIDARLSRER